MGARVLARVRCHGCSFARGNRFHLCVYRKLDRHGFIRGCVLLDRINLGFVG